MFVVVVSIVFLMILVGRSLHQSLRIKAQDNAEEDGIHI